MMASASITVRTDDKLKAEATSLFANLGMDMTTAINVFLRAAVKSSGIPFAVTEEPDEEYKAWMKQKLAESWAQRNDPNVKSFTLEEIKEKYGI